MPLVTNIPTHTNRPSNSIGTEAASALTMHLTKIATYGAGSLLTTKVLLFGVALTPATLAPVACER